MVRKNHITESKVSVIIHRKHTSKPSPSHRELMGEAICFGWIDTILKSLDEDRYIRTFSKRNKNSKWSNNTLTYAKELIKQNKMNPQGYMYYLEGLKKPTHDFGIPKHPEMPEELKIALSKNKKARENFDKIIPSQKRVVYRWILFGKREETQTRRITQVVERSKIGEKDLITVSKKECAGRDLNPDQRLGRPLS